uniref:N-acylneuraminate cytidylyltransferase n=1 Tax=Candidatus Kentrum sp. FM TaxID=2126340 RepID=A0A450VVV9_9GAMM|nr:MAG: N-acylneuraminate cytidylyltransferase [Candidatus Kentron sp. FM]VFJ57286.1 MAG: N-acylneuraminate cytidylyltransferase [Candidatus Kentron sp. FM]VFK08924.1 MAG: N-acylneuraminate cytidylyltransferase [Candidatus Kentron sp. FM]
MNIAIIPARGGSKRIPRKNIRDFCGMPMIARSIATARDSGLFEHIIVSTDDEEIADVAKKHGAEIPFVRPAELADNYAGTIEVVAHAARWLLERQWPINAVCCLYATAPFVRPDDMRLGLEMLQSGPWAYTFTATEYASPIFRSFRVHPQGGVEMFFPERFDTRSQDLPVALHDAGQFYWGWPDSWLKQKKLFDRHSSPIIIPNWRVQDIDTEEDWRRAELLHNILRKNY